ncbi:MAG: HAMP domain-containing histidine kinase [Spirochaetales bacterium]|nr:MAG: HAMP domain-containing histidine kinase [Spirochaetales bacterium]
MTAGKKVKMVFPVILMLLTAAALGLGILQFRWLTMVSRLQEERLRKSLRVSAEQVIRSCNEEIWSLRAPLYLTGDEFAQGDFQRFNGTIDYWKQNTQFPELIDSIYALHLPEGGKQETKKYDMALGAFTDAGIPEILSGFVNREITNSEDYFSLEENLLRQGYFIGQPAGFVRQETAGKDELAYPVQPPEILLPLRIDLEVMLYRVIPHYMEQYLDGYPYRIIMNSDTDPGPETAVPAPADGAAVSRPDLVLDLYGPVLVRFHPTGSETERYDGRSRGTAADDLRTNTASRLLLPLLRDMDEHRREGRFPAASASLEIFYPGNSIDRFVFVQRLLNSLLSSGVLLLLMASTIVMYSLYRRTLAQKIMEQEFTASMSHELRTPIAVLKSATQNIAEGIVTPGERLKEYGGIMDREVTRLSRMVESILLYSGLEQANALSSDPGEMDAAALINDVADSIRLRMEQENCELEIDLGNLSGPLPFSREALRLILENLLMNALHHGLPAERTKANPAALRLKVSRLPYGKGLEIAVEDEGMGIPAREQGRIFEPFVRGEASMRLQRPGSGLGLHLVKRITELMKGKVSVESPYRDSTGKERRGARFTVNIPFPEKPRKNGKFLES